MSLRRERGDPISCIGAAKRRGCAPCARVRSPRGRWTRRCSSSRARSRSSAGSASLRDRAAMWERGVTTRARRPRWRTDVGRRLHRRRGGRSRPSAAARVRGLRAAAGSGRARHRRAGAAGPRLPLLPRAALRPMRTSDVRRRVPLVRAAAAVRARRALRLLGRRRDRAGVVHALKYGGWHRVAARDGGAHGAARLAGRRRSRSAPRSCRCRCPRSASGERGYNQSAASRARARAALARAGVERRARAHARNRDANPIDTGGAPPQRFGRVRRASVRRGTRFAARTSSLVDDVVTTGATLNACAAALFAGGARIVSLCHLRPGAGHRRPCRNHTGAIRRDDDSRRDQRIRPHRPPGAARGQAAGRRRHRVRRGQRPHRHEDARAPVQVRLGARHLSRRRRAPAPTRSPSTATRSRSSPRRIRRSCRGRTSASTSCSNRPAGSPNATTRASTSTRGAKKVIISAPAKGEDITIVLGVNDDEVRSGEAPRSSRTRRARRTASCRW